MLTFKAEIKDIVKTFENDLILTIKTKAEDLPDKELNSLVGAKNGVKIDISQWREQRSLNANAYAWVLMDKIAKVQRITKEEVYKMIMQRVGVFEILPIKNIALDTFIKRWESKGLGWLVVVDRESKLPNYTNVLAYYGTSTYNTEEMTRFIDEIVSVAKDEGIQTLTPNQLLEMKSLWSEYEKKDK